MCQAPPCLVRGWRTKVIKAMNHLRGGLSCWRHLTRKLPIWRTLKQEQGFFTKAKGHTEHFMPLRERDVSIRNCCQCFTLLFIQHCINVSNLIPVPRQTKRDPLIFIADVHWDSQSLCNAVSKWVQVLLAPVLLRGEALLFFSLNAARQNWDHLINLS